MYRDSSSSSSVYRVYSSLSVLLQRESQDKSPAGQYLQLKTGGNLVYTVRNWAGGKLPSVSLSIELTSSIKTGGSRISSYGGGGGGAHLKKLHREEGGAKIVWIFRVKNHDFTPKNHIFSNFRGGRASGAPPPPPPVSAPVRYCNLACFVLLN